MEGEQIALAGSDAFIASIIVNSSENPQNDESLMSDADFAQELQLQEVIISSLINLHNNKPPVKIVEIGEPSSSKTAAKEESGGESSQSLCEICAEKKDKDSMFPLQNCTHNFCNDCISRHISIKIHKRTIIINNNNSTIACPDSGCSGAMGMAACREIVPADVVSKWDEVLCESAIAAAERIYCPYNNCSALLVNDGGGDGVEIREAECPFCRRLFCAKCRVPWHAGIDCEGFSLLGKDEREREDLMVHDLAKKNNWKRCSRCNFFVERNEGCLHMTCRCGYQFCYACGITWSSTHSGCQ